MPGSETFYLGVNIGGTESSAILGTASGEILHRRVWATRAASGLNPALEQLFQHVSLLLLDARAVAAGVAIGGPLDAERGVICGPPNLPGWDNVPLKQLLQEKLKLPVAVEHDAAACALAEYRWGKPTNAKRLLYLTCGTGFGVGFVIDGRIYRGAGGMNCEIGHIRLSPEGPEAFGKRGSAEAFCAGGSLGKLAQWMFPYRWEKPVEGYEIASLARGGDADAAAVLARNAQAVGEVAAMLGDFLRPDYIALGSLARHLGEHWVRQVRDKFLAEVLPATAAACTLAPASLAERLQDLSALATAITASERTCN